MSLSDRSVALQVWRLALAQSLPGGCKLPCAARGSSEFMDMWAGQAYRLNRAMPAAELVATLAREATARLAAAV